jgi:hypothetical protein
MLLRLLLLLMGTNEGIMGCSKREGKRDKD